jgi:hypothetical protein
VDYLRPSNDGDILQRKCVFHAMIDYPRPINDGDILNYPIQSKAEFGLINSEFGNKPLFHTGLKRVWDYCKKLSDGVI